MGARKAFQECLSRVPNDLKRELDLSFAIADKIDAILKEGGITQKELAKKTGKTQAEVSRWLCGTHNFTLRTIAKIEEALGRQIIGV